MAYVAWRKKPIGQRALELACMESDKEILDILHKEYGKEQLDRWLGIAKETNRLILRTPIRQLVAISKPGSP